MVQPSEQRDGPPSAAGGAEEPRLGAATVALLCARLCHELTSPLTAVHNGLELIADGAAGDRAVTLARTSAERAQAAMALQRAALGTAAERGDVAATEVGVRLGQVVHAAVTVTWGAAEAGRIDAQGGPAVKLAANLGLVAVEALNGRGTVELATTGQGMTVTASGPRAGLSAAGRAALAGTCDESALDAGTVVAYHAGVTAQRFGYTVTVIDEVAGDAAGSVLLQARRETGEPG